MKWEISLYLSIFFLGGFLSLKQSKLNSSALTQNQWLYTYSIILQNYKHLLTSMNIIQ